MTETFAIESFLNGKVVEVEGGKATPGTPIVMSPKQSPPSASQQWKLQHSSSSWFNVVSGMSDDLVLTVEGRSSEPGARLILSSKNSDDSMSQNFLIIGNHIWSEIAAMVLDIEGGNTNDGARVVLWKPKFDETDKNQRWKLDGKFSIRSQMHGKVMDVKGASAQPGAEVIMWPKNWPPSDNQLWEMKHVMDKPVNDQGWSHVCSKLNENLVLGLKGGSSDPGTELCLQEKQDPPANSQLFLFNQSSLTSCLCGNPVLEIEGASEENGARIVLAKEGKCSKNQQWDIGC